MSIDRETTRILRSWLRDVEHESADRILDEVLARLEATPQRRSWWPARRIDAITALGKLSIAVAAVILIAVVGYDLLPIRGSIGVGGPTASPSPSPAPSPTRRPTPSPSPVTFVLPPPGAMAVGRHDLMVEGVSFSIEVPSDGWTSNGSFGIDHGAFPATWDAGFIIWADAPDGIYTDPCTQTEGSPIAPSAADLADAAAHVPGTEATGPSDVIVGGFPAKLVVVKIPDVASCRAEDFYLWWDRKLTGRYATVLGSTIRVWLIDVNGTIIWIDGETPPDARPEAGRQIQQIIDSIRFE